MIKTPLEVFLNITTNSTCPKSLLWKQSIIESTQPQLIFCIIASFLHTCFWLQIIFCPPLRQVSLQWIYSYLVTDILVLFRFFFTYTVRTRSTECKPHTSWFLFNCYFETIFDIYLNILVIYILVALNLCRHWQIAYNRNVYQVHQHLLVFSHIAIYVMPLFFLIIQLLVGWTKLEASIGNSCQLVYMNIYIQVLNVIFAFVLPAALNIVIIYASFHHIRLESALRQGQHHLTAREKYNRTLFIQFLCFYIIWVSLWAPNVIVYQISVNEEALLNILWLLNFIGVAVDPIIIAALDVRFYREWNKLMKYTKETLLHHRPKCRRIQPYPPGNIRAIVLKNNLQ